MHSCLEVQLCRISHSVSFLQVITAYSGSCSITILSGQNQKKKKKIHPVCYILASSKTNKYYKVAAGCTRLHA